MTNSKALNYNTLTVENKTAIGIIAIPSGDNRLFNVKAYSGDGNIEYEGEAKVEHLVPGIINLLEGVVV